MSSPSASSSERPAEIASAASAMKSTFRCAAIQHPARKMILLPRSRPYPSPPDPFPLDPSRIPKAAVRLPVTRACGSKTVQRDFLPDESASEGLLPGKAGLQHLARPGFLPAEPAAETVLQGSPCFDSGTRPDFCRLGWRQKRFSLWSPCFDGGRGRILYRRVRRPCGFRLGTRNLEILRYLFKGIRKTKRHAGHFSFLPARPSGRTNSSPQAGHFT